MFSQTFLLFQWESTSSQWLWVNWWQMNIVLAITHVRSSSFFPKQVLVCGVVDQTTDSVANTNSDSLCAGAAPIEEKPVARIIHDKESVADYPESTSTTGSCWIDAHCFIFCFDRWFPGVWHFLGGIGTARGFPRWTKLPAFRTKWNASLLCLRRLWPRYELYIFKDRHKWN